MDILKLWQKLLKNEQFDNKNETRGDTQTLLQAQGFQAVILNISLSLPEWSPKLKICWCCRVSVLRLAYYVKHPSYFAVLDFE
eukprot:6446346-Amphidinium_carterae.1